MSEDSVERIGDLAKRASEYAKTGVKQPVGKSNGRAVLADSMEDLLDKYMLTDEEADAIADPKWLYKNLIISGHLIVITGPSNSGKTTIVFHLMCELAREMKAQVFYIHSDVSGGDVKPYRRRAIKAGVNLITPGYKAGASMKTVVNDIFEQINLGRNFEGEVYVFDTFKKMCDLMQKKETAEVLDMLQRMAALGGTVILLGHTNKNPGHDGEIQFEGVGDVKNDSDDLIYLRAIKDEQRNVTVTTDPDSVRGAFDPITFLIDGKTLAVTRTDYVDTELAARRQSQKIADMDAIEAINEAIEQGLQMQTDIVEFCTGKNIGAHKTQSVLKKWSNLDGFALWHRETGMNNSKHYSRLPF
jgi:RecA-family ATPase